MSVTESLWRVGEVAIARNTDTGETFPVVRTKVGLGEIWLSPHGREISRELEFTAHSELPQPADPEPAGLGAVVKDKDGDPWIRISHDEERWSSYGCDPVSWAVICAHYMPITVRSHGIEDTA